MSLAEEICTWRLREAWRNGELTEEQISRLEKIGFQFEPSEEDRQREELYKGLTPEQLQLVLTMRRLGL